jgi:hypothetical protein
MSNIDAPRGSVENSWIVEVFHNQNSVNIKIESGQTLRDVSAEILYRAKLADGDYALHEFLCNGQLQVGTWHIETDYHDNHDNHDHADYHRVSIIDYH